MSINVGTKGQTGEREIANRLEYIIRSVLTKLNLPVPTVSIIQRNQNQSAVGGNDLTNTFGLSIEVKRQETLQINAWWKQCVAAAARNNEIPVLIFRQNRKSWRVVMFGYIQISESKQLQTRIEIDWEDFQNWFYLYVESKLNNGYELQV